MNRRQTKRAHKRIIFVFCAFFCSLLLASKTSAMSLPGGYVNMFSQNDILFYSPCGGSDGDDGEGKCYSGKEITWDDLNKIGEGDTKASVALLTETYGELAMELQEEYGVPWELVFIQMGNESGGGVNRSRSVAISIRDKDGKYNLLGMDVPSNRNKNKWMSDTSYPYKDGDNGSSHEAAEYDDISTMIIGYHIAYFRNGIYDESFKYWDYKNYDFWTGFQAAMCHYVGTPGSCSSSYSDPNGNGGFFYDVVDKVRKEKGWPTSKELAEQKHIEPGGKWPVSGDIREEVWAKYGKAGRPGCTRSSNAIVEKAKELSWEIGDGPQDNPYIGNDAYNKAAKNRGGNFVSGCRQDSVAEGGTGICYSCARFVSLVLLESGVDADFTNESKDGDHYKPHMIKYEPGGLSYYLDKSDKWAEVKAFDGINYSALEPGDILINDTKFHSRGCAFDHTLIYLGDGIIAEGDNSRRAPHQYPWEGNVANGYTAYRLKGVNNDKNRGDYGSTAADTIKDAKNYAGDDIFTADQLSKIEANRKVYEEAAKSANIPWQVLAVLHAREHSLSLENPSNGQGIFQLSSLYEAGEKFPSTGTADEAEFLRQAKMAAEIFKRKSGGRDLNSEAGIKYTFFSYNGTASSYKAQALALGFSQEEAEVGEGSPYVMNRYDEKRDPTKETTKNNQTWGEIKVDHGAISYPAGTNFGAFVQYAALTGLGWSTGSNSVSDTSCPDDNKANGNGRIAQVARDLAWPDSNHQGEIKPEYADAARKVGLSGYATNWSEAADCGKFVTVVLRFSGADPDFPSCCTWIQEDHMEASDLWEEIPNNGSEDNLKPGDVFVVNQGGGAGASGHIFIYIGDGQIAQASLGDYTGLISSGVKFSDHRGSYKIFRSTVDSDSEIGAFDEDLKKIESSSGAKVGVAVTTVGNKDTSAVQTGGSWTGGRAWSTIKVPLAIAAVQNNASTGTVTSPYGGQCSGGLDNAINGAITRSDNCDAWWLWQALGGDNSSAAETVTGVLRSGGDSSTSVVSAGDGSSLTSGKTTWQLVDQAIFAANMSSISGASKVMNEMRTHAAGDGSHGLNSAFTTLSKGGWGDSGNSATRQFGIIKLNNGKCSAVAIGTNAGSNFSILDEIAQVLLNHQNDLPSGACPSGI